MKKQDKLVQRDAPRRGAIVVHGKIFIFDIEIPFSVAAFAIVVIAILAAVLLPTRSSAFDASDEPMRELPLLEGSAPGLPEPDAPMQRWLHTGMVFPDSHERLLTEEDIACLGSSGNETRQTLIRAAINEIYARNGYAFYKGELRDFYEQFCWYAANCDMETARDGFNPIERENVMFLLKYE